MPSRATHFRWRNILLTRHAPKISIPHSKLPERSSCVPANTEEFNLKLDNSSTTHTTLTTPNAGDLISSHTTTNDIFLPTRRAQPTSCDIAASAMIFKARRSLNNRDLDVICKLLSALNVKDVPKSMKGIQEKLHPNFDLKSYCKCYYICSECGESNSDHIIKCESCSNTKLFEFYLCPIKQQMQQLLSLTGMYTKLQNEKHINIELFSHTKYGQILKEITNDSFTMIINSDGVCTPNKNLSLWPFVLTLNELPIPDRRYLENVLVAGIIPAVKKPTHAVFETCLDLIHVELMELESGQQFYVNDVDQQKIIHFYTIASCTDKPAEALMENIVQYNAEYGCSKCFCEGELYHGERGVGKKKKQFTIRVYPFGDYELRTQERCSQIIQDSFDYVDQGNDTVSNNTQNGNALGANEASQNRYGHLGRCPLTALTYFDYGTSFLTDSLHTIYGGAFKKLMRLLFDCQYRREPWSLYKKIALIDELLSHVKIPSTTQRRFGSIKSMSKYKASEYRSIFHFGVTTIIRCMDTNMHKSLLLSFVTAINLASAEYVTEEIIELVEKLLYYFVEQFQMIFGLRHMSSNIHSLLHVGESLKLIGPLWMCSTFSFEGIDKDLVSTVHGTTDFAKQLIRQHVLFRDAIIRHQNQCYPLSLFTFNQQLLNRKQTKTHYKTIIDGCCLPKSVSADLYDTSENGIATYVQSYFKDRLTFYHSLMISNVMLKTTAVTYGKLVADNCISFRFADNQQRYGLIRAIVKSEQDTIRLFIEELIEKTYGSSKIKFKVDDEPFELPNVLELQRSNVYHLKHPQLFIKKHALIFKPGNFVTVLEYPNLKDSS